MKLLSLIWIAPTTWENKRAFLVKLASEAAAAGDLPLALQAWLYIAHGDSNTKTKG